MHRIEDGELGAAPRHPDAANRYGAEAGAIREDVRRRRTRHLGSARGRWGSGQLRSTPATTPVQLETESTMPDRAPLPGPGPHSRRVPSAKAPQQVLHRRLWPRATPPDRGDVLLV